MAAVTPEATRPRRGQARADADVVVIGSRRAGEVDRAPYVGAGADDCASAGVAATLASRAATPSERTYARDM